MHVASFVSRLWFGCTLGVLIVGATYPRLSEGDGVSLELGYSFYLMCFVWTLLSFSLAASILPCKLAKSNLRSDIEAGSNTNKVPNDQHDFTFRGAMQAANVQQQQQQVVNDDQHDFQPRFQAAMPPGDDRPFHSNVEHLGFIPGASAYERSIFDACA